MLRILLLFAYSFFRKLCTVGIVLTHNLLMKKPELKRMWWLAWDHMWLAEPVCPWGSVSLYSGRLSILYWQYNIPVLSLHSHPDSLLTVGYAWSKMRIFPLWLAAPWIDSNQHLLPWFWKQHRTRGSKSLPAYLSHLSLLSVGERAGQVQMTHFWTVIRYS